MPRQALFKILYSDLQIVGELATGHESESFSSGQVAVRFGKDSNKNPRPSEKQSGGERGILYWSEFSSKLRCFDPVLTLLPRISVLNVGERSVSDIACIPCQGMAIDALWDRKLSLDQIVFVREEVLSWLV